MFDLSIVGCAGLIGVVVGECAAAHGAQPCSWAASRAAPPSSTEVLPARHWSGRGPAVRRPAAWRRRPRHSLRTSACAGPRAGRTRDRTSAALSTRSPVGRPPTARSATISCDAMCRFGCTTCPSSMIASRPSCSACCSNGVIRLDEQPALIRIGWVQHAQVDVVDGAGHRRHRPSSALVCHRHPATVDRP